MWTTDASATVKQQTSCPYQFLSSLCVVKLGILKHRKVACTIASMCHVYRRKASVVQIENSLVWSNGYEHNVYLGQPFNTYEMDASRLRAYTTIYVLEVASVKSLSRLESLMCLCFWNISSVECKRVASAFWWFFRRSVFLFYNKMCIGNNLNLILNDWKVIGSYLKPLTIC